MALDSIQGEQAEDDRQAMDLVADWQRALAGDLHAQEQWRIFEGGKWTWQNDGVHVSNRELQWLWLEWQRCGSTVLQGMKNFVIEMTLSGKATAAGLSFGPYKDFLIGLEPEMGARRLQLEVDVVAGRWAFRVDGQLMQRCWWDSAIHSTEDIVNGALTLKGHCVEQVVFQDLTLHTFKASCQLSVIITCYRFLQRLRISLRNWCHQEVPSGTYEVLVVNPASPDGTHEHLNAVASSFPHVRIREVAVESNLATNKGKMINRALAMSQGKWIWLADADSLFAPTCVARVLTFIGNQRQYLFYGQRRHLTASQTNALLAGRIDGLADFEALAQVYNPRGPDNAPWGYTQIVHRSVMERVRYREDINHFAHSDMVFIESCKRLRVMPRQIEDLVCLHMEHDFAWYGTNAFL
jgi:hypothetical protein